LLSLLATQFPLQFGCVVQQKIQLVVLRFKSTNDLHLSIFVELTTPVAAAFGQMIHFCINWLRVALQAVACVERAHLLQTKQWKMHGARNIIVLSICHLWVECFPLQELAWLPSLPRLHCPWLVVCNLWLASTSFMTEWATEHNCFDHWSHALVDASSVKDDATTVRCTWKSFSMLMFVWVGLPHWQAADKCPFPEGIEKGLFLPCPCHCCFQQLSNWASLSADWLFDWKTSCLAG